MINDNIMTIWLQLKFYYSIKKESHNFITKKLMLKLSLTQTVMFTIF